MADATVLFFSSPIWTPFVARIVLKEPFKISNFIAIFVGFIGVIFVLQPNIIFKYFAEYIPFSVNNNNDENDNEDDIAKPGSVEYTISAIVCIFGAFTSSCVYAIIRKSGGKIKFQVLIFYYGLLGGK